MAGCGLEAGLPRALPEHGNGFQTGRKRGVVNIRDPNQWPIFNEGYAAGYQDALEDLEVVVHGYQEKTTPTKPFLKALVDYMKKRLL